MRIQAGHQAVARDPTRRSLPVGLDSRPPLFQPPQLADRPPPSLSSLLAFLSSVGCCIQKGFVREFLHRAPKSLGFPERQESFVMHKKPLWTV